jgi:diguanylate cyclase (GGDEF)-like protein
MFILKLNAGTLMEETLERELRRASRKGLSVGVIMLDVDDFKRFNDTYGHAAGDAILRELGNLLLKHVREEDVLARYGGDEFIIILPDVSQAVTRERAELICEDIKQFRFQFEGQNLETVTLSLGIAIFPEHGLTSTGILKAADEALYRAKQEGRNRAVMASY